jgi:hypothetical protein
MVVTLEPNLTTKREHEEDVKLHVKNIVYNEFLFVFHNTRAGASQMLVYVEILNRSWI